MTTEYYQIPSQQGLLLLDADPDPWLAAAASSLSLSDWGNVKSKPLSPPSLFEPGDVDAVSWKHVVPMQLPTDKQIKAPKAPKAPKEFTPTSSKIDAWSVVDTSELVKQKKQPKQQKNEQPKVTIEDELAHQNISTPNYTICTTYNTITIIVSLRL